MGGCVHESGLGCLAVGSGDSPARPPPAPAAQHRAERRRGKELADLKHEGNRILQEWRRIAGDPALDAKVKGRNQTRLEERLAQVNEKRVALELPALTLASALASATGERGSASSSSGPIKERVYKWYHPTFNPHGPPRPVGGGLTGEDDDDMEDDGRALLGTRSLQEMTPSLGGRA